MYRCLYASTYLRIYVSKIYALIALSARAHQLFCNRKREQCLLRRTLYRPFQTKIPRKHYHHPLPRKTYEHPPPRKASHWANHRPLKRKRLSATAGQHRPEAHFLYMNNVYIYICPICIEIIEIHVCPLYVYTYIYTSIHPYIYSSIHPYIHTSMNTSIHTCIHIHMI